MEIEKIDQLFSVMEKAFDDAISARDPDGVFYISQKAAQILASAYRKYTEALSADRRKKLLT